MKNYKDVQFTIAKLISLVALIMLVGMMFSCSGVRHYTPNTHKNPSLRDYHKKYSTIQPYLPKVWNC